MTGRSRSPGYAAPELLMAYPCDPKVALWFIQNRPELRPIMSVAVKMLEGGVEIPALLYPFKHLLMGSPGTHNLQAASATLTGSTFTWSSFICTSPIMRKYDIQMAHG
ncbi:hypothetical protein WN943_002768 [Citrus x changshan-huyou]